MDLSCNENTLINHHQLTKLTSYITPIFHNFGRVPTPPGESWRFKLKVLESSGICWDADTMTHRTL